MVDISRLAALATAHREQGLQRGSQVYASVGGKIVVNLADGEAVPGRSLSTESVMRWYEAGMPLISILVGRLIERGKLGLDDPVGRHLPNWGNGKQTCTVRHLLTHMGGFAGAELGDRDLTDKEALLHISSYRAEYTPGSKAGFHPTSSWRVLAAIIESIEGRPAPKLIDRHIFKPLGIRDRAFTHLGLKTMNKLGSEISPVHWCGYSVQARDDDGDLVEVPHNRDVIHNTAWHVSRWEPGISTWGSATALGRVYEGLLDPKAALFDSDTTLELMTATHRHGVRDRALRGAEVPWGLGFQVAGAFGGSVGHRAFGHGGMTGRAICDPVERLVLIYLTNGLTGRIDHERRMAEMTDALYETVVPGSTGAWITTSLRAAGVSQV